MNTRTASSVVNKLDWTLITSYILLMLIGWITIYSAGYNPEKPNIFDFSMTYGKQFIWIILSLVLAFIIINSSSKIFSVFAYFYFFLTILLLILVFFFAKEVNGAKAWIDLGFFRLQPSEFAKLSTALALSQFISELDSNLSNLKNLLIGIGICILPMGMVLAQHDMGSALVFLSFFFLLNRFGMSNYIIFAGFFLIIISILSLVLPPYVLIGMMFLLVLIFIFLNRNNRDINQIFIVGVIAILFVGVYSYSIDFVVKKLDRHQQDRINVLLGKGGNDWNVRQSKIAIGAGQIYGKGFKKGTQSKGNFLPAKDTDFIFCTIGEEWGFVGSVLVIGLMVFIMLRILFLAEKQKSKFAKVYGYAIVCILMVHYLINIGMTLGLVPVIGIPLPALSYGGSSLISFTVMIFAFIRMDSEKWIY
ncbi:MAG: rod shape-determining protein RodA [Chitinophagales bacterium]